MTNRTWVTESLSLIKLGSVAQSYSLKPYRYQHGFVDDDWETLKTEVTKKIRDENDDETRIKRLKSIMQSNNETIREYVNWFEPYMEPIKDTVRKNEKLDWFLEGLKNPVRKRVEFRCPKKYENARDWAIQVENYKKKKDSRNVQKETDSKEEDERSIQKEIDELTAAFSDMKINCVDQAPIKREKVESIVKEVLMKERKGKGKNLNQKGSVRMIKCFNCQEEGHMARNCPKQKHINKNESADVKIIKADVRLMVLTEGPFDIEQDQLQLEIRDVEELFNVRAVKRKLDGLPKPTSKRSKMQETVIAGPSMKRDN
ncbi:5127_t:CDS:2, partial [Gigaspora rosea]